MRVGAAPVCVQCGYDLAGLASRGIWVCPECGATISSDNTRLILARESARRWRLAVLSPVFALPGLLVLIVGQPVLCFALAAGFAYRAIEFDDEMLQRPSSRFGRFLQAFLFGLVWTSFSAGVLALVAAGAMVVFGWFVR